MKFYIAACTRSFCSVVILSAALVSGCSSPPQATSGPQKPICEAGASPEGCGGPPPAPKPAEPKPDKPDKPDRPDKPDKPGKDMDKQGRGEILQRSIQGIYFHFTVRCKSSGRVGRGASANEDAALTYAFGDCAD
jgi:hypothetical protein